MMYWNWRTGFCLFFISTTNIAFGDDHKKGHDWCYDQADCGPLTWESTCSTGKSQSPIDINDKFLFNSKYPSMTLWLSEEYTKNYSDFNILNNGHTVQFNLPENNRNLEFGGNGLKDKYCFAQAHFHWGTDSKNGSEHTMNGKAFPMELHLVHYACKYKDLGEALEQNDKRALAVFGVFLEMSANDNLALKPIVDNLKKVEDPSKGTVEASGSLNFRNLLPTNMVFYRYAGSLTTPSCAEKVLWTVFKTPITISESQLAAFNEVSDSRHSHLTNNYRPVQPLGTRRIMVSGTTHLEIRLQGSREPTNGTSEEEIDTNQETKTSTTTKKPKNEGKILNAFPSLIAILNFTVLGKILC